MMRFLILTLIYCSFLLGSTYAQMRGSEGCAFNQGTCPMDVPSGRGRNHGYVQDYGYGGLTSAGAVGIVRVLNPGLIIAEIANGAPINPECVWSLGARAQTLGGRVWNGKCADATRSETQTLQCAGQAGLGYSFDANFNNLLAVNENLDPVQEELVYQTAVSDIRDFTTCQKSLFDTYASDTTMRNELLNNAYQQFMDVKGPLERMQRQKTNLMERLLGRRSLLSSSTCMSSFDCIQADAAIPDDPEVSALTARIGDLEKHMNLLVSRIPMGNRDTMAQMLRGLIRQEGPVSRAQFIREYNAEMTNMGADVNRSMETINAITVSHPDGDVNFCVDRELKKNLVRSGQLQTTVDRMELTDALGGFTCRAENRYGVAGEVITELALIPTYFVGYGAARLALRAGASTIRAVASAGRTLATATRGAMLGLEAADWGFATAAVIRDCNSDEFFARVESQRGCNAMGEVGQLYEEASLAQCLSSALIPAGSAMIGSTVRLVSSRRLAAATPGATVIGNVVEEVVEEGGTIGVTAQKIDFFLSREDAAAVAARLRANNIVPGRRLTDTQLATLTPQDRVSLFENMGDTALSRGEARRFLDILSDGGGRLEGRAENRLRDLLRDLGKEPDEINTIISRAKSNRLFESPPAGSQSLVVRSADEAVPAGAVPRVTPAGAADAIPTSAGPARPVPTPGAPTPRVTRSTDELLGELSDELRLAVPDNVAARPDLSTFADETRAAIRGRFDSWSPEMRAQVSELLGQVQGQERRRYLAMLLNAQPANDPSRTLSRIRRMKSGDANVQTQVMQELDAQIEALAEQMRGRNIADLQGVNLGAQRSALMMERTLYDLGDEVEIQRIFSTDAYNDVARAAGREPHSLSGSFNVDIKVTGDNVSVCRGSMATASALSPLAGGFTTICRRGGYIDNFTASDVLAAPRSAADGDLGGYSRFNRFDIEPGTEVSMGRNGPVAYTFNGAEGTGGNGGGVEFFFSRSQTPLDPSDLSVSVRIPTCQGGAGTRCAQILDIQSQVRVDDLRGVLNQDGPTRLASATTRTDTLVRELANEADLLSAGETAAQALRRLERENPELLSALNLRRELDLKTAPSVGRRDADTELMLSRIREAGTFGPQTSTAIRGAATDAAGAQRRISEAVRENPLTRAYNQMQTEAEQLLTRASRATDPVDRDALLRELARVRGQQSDVRLAYHTYVYNLEKALKTELGLGSRAPLPQGFLDAINSGAGGIVIRSN